ncbi:hypothetical protein HN011_004124 [Eciton burchellii]|nr:hypothetical protein HN011_004124 [Eciton burchellii]
MADDLDDLLEKQATVIDTLKRVLINYKKLPKVNVTLIKTRSRLVDLQKYWEKVQDLHAKIRRASKAEDRKKLPYFLQDEFLVAEDVYNEAADYLQEAIGSFVAPESPANNTPTDTTVDDEP